MREAISLRSLEGRLWLLWLSCWQSSLVPLLYLSLSPSSSPIFPFLLPSFLLPSFISQGLCLKLCQCNLSSIIYSRCQLPARTVMVIERCGTNQWGISGVGRIWSGGVMHIRPASYCCCFYDEMLTLHAAVCQAESSVQRHIKHASIICL